MLGGNEKMKKREKKKIIKLSQNSEEFDDIQYAYLRSKAIFPSIAISTEFISKMKKYISNAASFIELKSIDLKK